jgi:hypothetical protein
MSKRKAKTKAKPKKPQTKWFTVGRSKNLKKAKTIQKAYPRSEGYKTKIVKQKSGHAVKLLGPK